MTGEAGDIAKGTLIKDTEVGSAKLDLITKGHFKFITVNYGEGVAGKVNFTPQAEKWGERFNFAEYKEIFNEVRMRVYEGRATVIKGRSRTGKSEIIELLKADPRLDICKFDWQLLAYDLKLKMDEEDPSLLFKRTSLILNETVQDMAGLQTAILRKKAEAAGKGKRLFLAFDEAQLLVGKKPLENDVYQRLVKFAKAKNIPVVDIWVDPTNEEEIPIEVPDVFPDLYTNEEKVLMNKVISS